MCFPYKWKRQFLRRENKDIDSLASHSKVVNSVAFILCVWNIYSEKINKSPQRSHKVFHLLQVFHWAEEKQNYMISSLSVSFKEKKDEFQNILRSVLIFNMKILKQVPMWMYIGSSKFASK